MRCSTLEHLTDRSLLDALESIVAEDCSTTVRMLVHIAEVSARKLYARSGYPSTYMFCVHELHMSADMAYNRVKAAFAGRRFPAILDAIADGRLHLTAVKLLEPHLRQSNVEELIATATHMTTREVRLLVAERFPKPDLPTLVRAIAGSSAAVAVEVGEAVLSADSNPASLLEPLVSKPVAPTNSAECSTAMVPVGALEVRTQVIPTSPGRYSVQLTISQETHDLLREAQALLGHSVPSGEIEAVLHRALTELVHLLRKQKYAVTTRPRAQRGSTSERHIPAEVRRAVSKRDGGRCTFVTDNGKRCDESTRLEWDHVIPVARGGTSTVDNLRLLCRAHNQYAADCAFGAEFMQGKREGAVASTALPGTRH